MITFPKGTATSGVECSLWSPANIFATNVHGKVIAERVSPRVCTGRLRLEESLDVSCLLSIESPSSTFPRLA